MGFLESIWEAIVNIADRIGTIITFFIDSIENVGVLISKFSVVDDALLLTESIFPSIFIASFTTLLGAFIAIRILRFITLQG